MIRRPQASALQLLILAVSALVAGILSGLAPPARGAGAPARSAPSGLRVDLAAINTTQLPTIRAYVTVADAEGNYLFGLKPSSFRLAADTTPIPRLDVKSVIESGEVIATALVIDRSGSMKGRPIVDAKNGAESFLALSGPTELIAVVDFGTNVNLTRSLSSDKARARRAIDSIRLSGDTALYDAVYAASQQLAPAQARRKAIVVLTDGKENRSKHSIDDCLKAVAPAIKVYTIGLGPTVEESSLRRLAAASGGLYYHSARSANLLDIYRKISEELHKEYVITATSRVGEDLQWHDLSVTVTAAGGSGQDHMPFLASTDPQPPIVSGPQQPAKMAEAPGVLPTYYALAAAMALVALFLFALILIVARRRPRPS